MIFILTLLILFSSGYCQTDDTASLLYFEKVILEELNLARQQPARYAAFLEQLKPFYVGKLIKHPGKVMIMTEEGVRAVEEAIRYLQSKKSMPPFRLSRGMSAAAADHVKDQGPTGATGHLSSDGSQPWDRIARYGNWEVSVGENIAYGRENPRDIVIGLIVDDGVPDRGHRKNIFNPEFHVIGVAAGFHATYRNMCVINFAFHFIEKQ